MKIGPLVTSLRPHQWTKNLVVFAALALSKHLFEAGPLVRSVEAFLIFCGLSGAVYLVNDVTDLERDRLHPRKSLRPIASGALSPRSALLAAGVLQVVCLLASWILSPSFAACAAAYLALNHIYSLNIKKVITM